MGSEAVITLTVHQDEEGVLKKINVEQREAKLWIFGFSRSGVGTWHTFLKSHTDSESSARVENTDLGFEFGGYRRKRAINSTENDLFLPYLPN